MKIVLLLKHVNGEESAVGWHDATVQDIPALKALIGARVSGHYMKTADAEEAKNVVLEFTVTGCIICSYERPNIYPDRVFNKEKEPLPHIKWHQGHNSSLEYFLSIELGYISFG